MIGLPFTVISGDFGMNFEVMLWLKQPWGIAAATVLMCGLSACAFALLRGRGWLLPASDPGRG